MKVGEYMIRVLHVGEYVRGGVATYLRTLLETETMGIQNYIVMASNKSSHDWNLPVERLLYYKYKRGTSSILTAILSVRRAIRKVSPHIIYCHSSWAGVFGRLAVLFADAHSHVIYNAHGWAFTREPEKRKLSSFVYAMIEKTLSHMTDAIINVSSYEYNAALQYGLSKKKMQIIFSGISPDKIQAHQSSTNFKASNLNLLFVGRLDRQKGLDWLLDIWKQCNRQDIHLYIAGERVVSDEKDVYSSADKRITYLGWLNANQLADCYQRCDAVIMPSRWEAFGLVAIEAMKYGKAILVSNRGALPELIKNEETGYIFDLDSGKDLLALLYALNKRRLEMMGNKANEDFLKKFTDRRMLTQTVELYHNLLERGFKS